MIIAYLKDNGLREQEITIENKSIIKKALWLDLINLSKEEEALIEKELGIDIPTRDEMREIELSSRLYSSNGNLFMTASMLAQSESSEPQYDAVTFVLTKEQLLTVRYIQPQAFRLFSSRLTKLNTKIINASTLLIELLDATVDRLADILEFMGHHLEEYSKKLFHKHPLTASSKLDYQHLLKDTGINADINTKIRESLMTFSRLLTYFGQSSNSWLNDEEKTRLDILVKDILSLSDHANFLSNKINFLLDATLGMVNIEQNKIIKIFSVAAVIFLPPTLIASVYGMNFHFIPELTWRYGYFCAIGLMMLSAWLPYRYFKWRNWL